MMTQQEYDDIKLRNADNPDVQRLLAELISMHSETALARTRLMCMYDEVDRLNRFIAEQDTPDLFEAPTLVDPTVEALTERVAPAEFFDSLPPIQAEDLVDYSVDLALVADLAAPISYADRDSIQPPPRDFLSPRP